MSIRKLLSRLKIDEERLRLFRGQGEGDGAFFHRSIVKGDGGPADLRPLFPRSVEKSSVPLCLTKYDQDVTEFSRALEQIAEIHEHLAKTEVFRGWRSLPVASSALVGLAAAAWQSAAGRTTDPVTFTVYWLAVGMIALVIGCAEIVWHYVSHASASDRRRSLQVVGQFLPALVGGAAVTAAVMRVSPSLVTLLPGLWALLFGVAVFAARPFVPRASGWVALYYSIAGLALLWSAPLAGTPSPWAVGGTFGIGQLFAAAALYWSVERPDRLRLLAQDPAGTESRSYGEKA